MHQNEYLALRHAEGDPLEREAREIMTPGVIVIVEDASLRHVYRAMVTHGVHAVLVVGGSNGTPVGWVTAHGLLGWIERDESMTRAKDAITERPVAVSPSAPAREAVVALSQAGVSRLLVQAAPDVLPEGVVTDLDLVALRSR